LKRFAVALCVLILGIVTSFLYDLVGSCQYLEARGLSLTDACRPELHSGLTAHAITPVPVLWG
jgi:hypothetical protein